MTGVAAMGVDVSLSRGLDVVAVSATRAIVLARARVGPGELSSLLRETGPGVVAIDGPPAWATVGKSRAIERQLLKLGISIYATPSEPAGRRFYDWMQESIRLFRVARRAGYATYRGAERAGRYAIEVFPHASAVALLGHLPAPRERKLDFRRKALSSVGVVVEALRTPDQVDAALAAVTGLRFLERSTCDVGVAREAVLVVPATALPARYRVPERPSDGVVESDARLRRVLSANAKQPSILLPDSGVNLEHTRKHQERPDVRKQPARTRPAPGGHA